ncbi:(R)-stereoselective amidase [Symmachiella macrocystis]|uniref:(R)-stereoselective amidase n=1 Tax=Symmachiella macrocystis TaxID=2527985 RepID=A0A5C6BGY8_9PLAN|nr:carbon-nitrogen hydrolase family protein [Symmachiella macrocystis]TWU09714.1 (R)-stereoselective amidase [Symmachiella macrocystis]
MRDQVRIAAVAVDTLPGDTTANINRLGSWTARAAEQGAELVLFQELSLTGFIPNHPTGNHEQWLRTALSAARRSAQPLNGPAVTQLADIARAKNILIATGMLEDAGNLLYNTHILVGPNGLLGHWRKMHIPMFEMPFYNGGGAPNVIDTPLGRIGANICFDALLPESTRLLAVQNAEIVLFPFAADPPPRTVEGWADWAGTALKARCAENGVFGIACNYVGHVECAGVEQNFPGGGMAVGPRGEVLAGWEGKTDEPGMLIVDLSADDLRAARAEPEYLFRFRRPELYGTLARDN